MKNFTVGKGVVLEVEVVPDAPIDEIALWISENGVILDRSEVQTLVNRLREWLKEGER